MPGSSQATARDAEPWAPWLRPAGALALRLARGFDRPAPARLLLALVSGVYVALALYLTRSTTAFVDEIGVFTQDGLRPSALLAPLNGHLALFQRLTYAIDWRLLGVEYVPLRLLEVVGVVVVAWELHVLMARRTGPAIAALAASLLLLLGSAWELNFVVSGLGNVAALAFGLGALLALERDDRRGDVLAAVLLVGAVVSFTLALAIVAGVVVRLALRRDGARRLWTVAAALVVWIAWFAWVKLSYEHTHPGAASSLVLGNVWLLPQAVAESAIATAGALTGTNYPFEDRAGLFQFSTSSVVAAPALVVALVLVGVRLRRRPGLVDPTLLGACVTAVAFWMILGLGYGIVGRGPSTVRYVYAGAVFGLLAAAGLGRGRRPGGVAVLVAAGLVVCAAASNLVRLRDGMAIYRPASLALRGVYAGLDVASPAADPTVTIGQGPLAYLQPVAVGPYLSTAKRLGSPGWSLAELVHRPEAERGAADGALVAALRLHLEPADADPAGCRSVPSGGQVRVGPPGVRVVATTAAGSVGLRRFASGTFADVGPITAGGQLLRLPADRSSRPWVLAAQGGALSVCPVR